MARRVWCLVVAMFILAACEGPAPAQPTARPTSTPPVWQPPAEALALESVTRMTLLGISQQSNGTTFGFDFSLDGRRLLTVSGDEAVRLWDLETGAPIWVLEDADASYGFFAVDDSQLVLVNRSQQVEVYSAENPRLLRSFRAHPGNVGPASVSPDGRLLAVGGEDGTVIVWDLAGEAERFDLEAHSFPVRGVVFSPDNRLLATFSSERAIRLWDMTTGETTAVLAEFDRSAQSVTFSPDSRLVAINTGNQIRVWQTADGVPAQTINLAERVADRQILMTANGYILGGGNQDTVGMWSLETGESYAGLPGHGQDFDSMALSPAGDLLVTVARPGPVFLWNMSDPNQRFQLMDGSQEITLAGWSPDGRILVLAAGNGALYFWGIPVASAATPVGG